MIALPLPVVAHSIDCFWAPAMRVLIRSFSSCNQREWQQKIIAIVMQNQSVLCTLQDIWKQLWEFHFSCNWFFMIWNLDILFFRYLFFHFCITHMFAITMIDKDNQLILFPSPGASFDPSYFPDTAFWSTFAKWVLKYLEMFVTDK